MIKGGWRSIVFLGATTAVLGWEVYASWDSDPDTCPWTDLIVTYLPGEVTAVLIGGLLAWLPLHFAIRYRRRGKTRRSAETLGPAVNPFATCRCGHAGYFHDLDEVDGSPCCCVDGCSCGRQG